MGGRERCGVFDGDKGVHGLYIPAVYEQTTPQKTSFKGDLQGTRVADPRLEAMALKPPIG